MMHSGLIVIGALIVRTQALKGQDFPIPTEELYENYTTKVDKECWTPKNLTRTKWQTCMSENELTVDYTCRYSLFGYKCFCCGAFFHYTEHGKICTKYCLLKDGRKFCQPGVIVLPFNWGDPIPDKVTLDDGGPRRGPDGVVRTKKETEVNVTAFEASPKCSSNPLKFHPERTPATLAPGEWEESQWASNATVRPDPRPVWQKSVEPPKKDWNDFVWSAEKGGRNPQTTTTSTTKRPSKNRLGDSHTFGGGVSTREQVPLEDVKETTTTTKRPSKNHLGDSHTFGGGGSISEQLRFEDVTEAATTTTTTRKPTVAKDRFGETAHAWGSEQSKQEPSDATDIDKRVSTSENRQEETRKSRPSKKKRTTKRPNLFGVGSNEVTLVDTGGVKLTTNAPTSTTTKSTTTEAEDQRPNWGRNSSSSRPSSRSSASRPSSRTSSSRPSSSRPRVEDINVRSSGDTNNGQDDKPNWG